jgi:YARHG domain
MCSHRAMRTIAFCSLLVCVLACKSKEDPAQTAQKPPLATASDAATKTPDEAANTPAMLDERCAAPCRFLADTPLADVATKLKSTCNAEWPQPGAKDCAQLDFQRNCIYATAGYAFKKQRYQAVFANEPWYKARADFKETDLTAVATANIAELKKRAGECRKGDVIEDRDRKVVDAWLAKIQTGKPEVPDILIDLGDKAEATKNLVANRDQFTTKRLRGMRYLDVANLREEWGKALAAKPARKIIEVDFSEPDDGKCGDDECGFGLWLTLALDDTDKVIGLEQSAAACPFVYRDGVRLGEILRNFNAPGREATQSLRVTAPCDGRVTYRIAEEKDEVTYLDELVLVIGTETLLPDVAALRTNDGHHVTLVSGTWVDVTFEIPPGACGEARLRANGHYRLGN